MLVFPVRRYTKNVSSGNQSWGLSSDCGLSNSGVGHRPTTTHIFPCSGIPVCLLYKSSVRSCAGIIIGTLLVACLRMVYRIVLLIWLFEHHSLRTWSSLNGWWLLLVTPVSPILSHSLDAWIFEYLKPSMATACRSNHRPIEWIYTHWSHCIFPVQSRYLHPPKRIEKFLFELQLKFWPPDRIHSGSIAIRMDYPATIIFSILVLCLSWQNSMEITEL